MRMMLTAIMPNEPFNTLVRENKVGALMGRILQDLKPVGADVAEAHGQLALVLSIEVADPSRLPAFAEPVFLLFDAECRFRMVMTDADLAKSGLETLAKKWH